MLADASSFGLGAVFKQKQPSGEYKAVAYTSRSLTETERRYAQIEKEGLAVTWATEKFQTYLLGSDFRIETDHKPLVPLLGMKVSVISRHGFKGFACDFYDSLIKFATSLERI